MFFHVFVDPSQVDSCAYVIDTLVHLLYRYLNYVIVSNFAYKHKTLLLI
jgi:hypothetical protein